MRITSMAWLIVAALLSPLFCVSGEAHELRTKNGNRVVMHAHYTPNGHATVGNNQPPSHHIVEPCAPDPLIPGVKPGVYVDPEQKQYVSPKTLLEAKQALEAFWRSQFPGPPGGPADPDYWKTKVTQVSQPSCRRNCMGDCYWWHSSTCSIQSPEAWKVIFEDDYELLPTGTPAAPGMLVVYRVHNRDTGKLTHVATVLEVDAQGNPTKVASTMAQSGTWHHPVDVVPPEYIEGGGGWRVWRKK